MSWHTSDRNTRLPNDWPKLRAAVIRRAHGKCQATHHAPNCNRQGTDVDHIQPGDNHTLDNLQLLSHECHKAKTTRENTARAQAWAALRRRPQEPHPGRINTKEQQA